MCKEMLLFTYFGIQKTFSMSLAFLFHFTAHFVAFFKRANNMLLTIKFDAVVAFGFYASTLFLNQITVNVIYFTLQSRQSELFFFVVKSF